MTGPRITAIRLLCPDPAATAAFYAAAFGAIVTSAVQDLFMPAIGAITGGLDFSNYYLPLSSKVQTGLAYTEAKKQGAVLGYGQFLTVSLNFVIVAFVLFMVIRAMNRLQHAEDKKPEAVAEVPADVKLLGEIRDILATRPKV